MKTIRFLAIILLISGSAMNSLKAQQKVVETSTFDLNLYLPCMGENATGTLTMKQTWWTKYGHSQYLTKGKLVGESGNIYEFNEIFLVQNNYNKSQPQGEGTQIHNFIITLEGTVIAQVKMTFHFTYNAQAEPTSYVYNSFEVVCE